MASLYDNDDRDEVMMMMRKTSLKGCPIADVCSTTEHVVIATFDGRVYTCDVEDSIKKDNYVKVDFPTSAHDHAVNIVSVCCGRHHFLALSANGLVYSWGRNNLGQLGTPKKKRKKQDLPTQPRLIHGLSAYEVIQIACGDDHSLALTRDGRLFSWGSNAHGQLGVETLGKRAKHHVGKPMEIEALLGVPFQHIAAGGAHSVVLSTTGSVFVWGRNSHGELGLQQIEDVKVPVKLGYMSREKVKDISCGMNHTSFLKEGLSNIVEECKSMSYGPCMLSNGQLLVYGIGTDRIPCDIEPWSKSELTPWRPHRFHTFSFIQSTSRCTYLVDEIDRDLYVLNHDKTGQDRPSRDLKLDPLGGRSFLDFLEPNSLTTWPPGRYSFDTKVWDIVAAVSLASANEEDECPEEEAVERDREAVGGQESNSCRTPRNWRRICAGQERIFIIEHEETESEEVHISVAPRRKVATLSAELIQRLKDAESDLTQASSLFQYASMVFSSPACINASFQQTGPYEENGLNVDLKAARQAFEPINKSTGLLKMISEVVAKDLCNNVLQSSSHDEDALRFYLIITECPIFSNPQHIWGRRVLAAIGRMMGFLGNSSLTEDANPNSAAAALARWWKLEPMSFRRTITAYRVALIFLINDRTILEKEVDTFWTYLRVLSSLNEVNLHHDILSIKTFYIPNIREVDFQPQMYSSRNPLSKFSWLSYPFLVDLEMKTKMLEFENALTQQMAVEDELTVESLWIRFCSPSLPPMPLHITVPRDDIFGTSIQEQLAVMLKYPRSTLLKPLMVTFEKEMGIDGGALSMDFFRLVFEELLDPEKNDLFRYITEVDPTHSSVWFRQDCKDTQKAKMCGLLLGLSLYNKALVPLPFPQLLYAKLLGKGPKSEMEEVAELDKDFADQMTNLRTGTEEDIKGSCYGDELELEDGRSVEVTKENVHLYVEKRVREYLVPGQFTAFQQGFNKVCNPDVLKMFRPIELEALVVGEKHFDWIALERSAQYAMPYTASHSTIKMFWKVFHELDDDMKRKFLVFISGSDRVPVGGLRNLGLTIAELPVPSDDSVADCSRLALLLPVANACANHGNIRTLKLPMYTTPALIEDRLIMVLSFCDCPFHIA